MCNYTLFNAVLKKGSNPTLLILRGLRSCFQVVVEPILDKSRGSYNHGLKHGGPRGGLPEVCNQCLQDLLVELALLFVHCPGCGSYPLLL